MKERGSCRSCRLGYRVRSVYIGDESSLKEEAEGVSDFGSSSSFPSS